MPMMWSSVDLPGARGPHDRDELALLDVDVDAPENVGPARPVRVGFFEIPQSDEGVRREGRLGRDAVGLRSGLT